jgi:hypothetical protein
VHVREHGQVVSKAVVIATGCRADGHREILGVDIGNSENETFWTEFLRDLVDRGLAGVRLVISDAHAGLRNAIRRVLQDAAWQRCRVHAKRNLLAVARHAQRQVISALISTIFAQPDGDAARTQLRAVVDQLATAAPEIVDRLQAMEPDLLAYTAFRPVHWSKIWSNNPISGDSTANSNGAPTLCRSSPTPNPPSGSSARCSSRSTTNSSPHPAATWPPTPSRPCSPTPTMRYRPYPQHPAPDRHKRTVLHHTAGRDQPEAVPFPSAAEFNKQH